MVRLVHCAVPKMCLYVQQLKFKLLGFEGNIKTESICKEDDDILCDIKDLANIFIQILFCVCACANHISKPMCAQSH